MTNSTQQQPTSVPAADDLGQLRPNPPVKIADHARYTDAQRSVDQLSDAGFPMSGVTIVWTGLRHVEHVTGRRTVATAARDGLLTGAWFGFIIGLLFESFAETSSSFFATLFTYSIVGALTVAVFQALQHWARRGTRDFSTIGRMDATNHEIWVEVPLVAQAQEILGSRSVRSNDPMNVDASNAGLTSTDLTNTDGER